MSLITNFPILLRTSWRDIRVNRGKINLLRRLFDTGAVKLAGTLLKRYIGRDWSDPFQTFVLRRNGIGATIQHLYQQQQITVAPNLALTILNWAAHSANADRSDLFSTMPRLRHQRETDLIKTMTQRRENHLIEQLLDQIVARKTRVEIRSEPSRAHRPITQMAEIPRVIRRGTSSKTDQALIAGDVNQRMEEKPQERKTGSENYRTPEPSLDLNRLTDQIIQKIDHRIVAQRERLGRV